MNLRQFLLDAQDINLGQRMVIHAKHTAELAAKRLPLEIVKPGSTLNVGQPAPFHLISKILKELPRSQQPLELPAQLLQMILAAAIK